MAVDPGEAGVWSWVSSMLGSLGTWGWTEEPSVSHHAVHATPAFPRSGHMARLAVGPQDEAWTRRISSPLASLKGKQVAAAPAVISVQPTSDLHIHRTWPLSGFHTVEPAAREKSSMISGILSFMVYLT